MALPGAGHPGQRPAAGVGEQVDLGGQPAPGPAQRLPPAGRAGSSRGGGFLSFDAAPCAGRGAQRGHRQPCRVDVRRRLRAARRRRAGAPGPPWHPPRPSTPCPPPHHSRSAAGPGSSPRSRPLTSGDAGCRRSSSSRTAPADPATGTRPGPGGTPRRSPPGDHSTGAPAADDRQQRLQPRPLRIGQIMPLQPVIIHGEIQAETTREDLRDTP